jgi:tripartite-type tricarboxylate transporter receptor subunit TctC
MDTKRVDRPEEHGQPSRFDEADSAGQRLAEIPLAQQLGVSRTPVRRALAMLAQEGLVSESESRGYLVREFSFQEVLDAIDLRGVLEGHAARSVAALAAGILACAAPGWAGAQEFPTKNVSIIVPNPPGGAIDVQARVYAQYLQQMWGKPVLVEYKPGAGTAMAMEYVAKSAPDGHTIGMVVTPMVILPALRKLPYDTMKDLAPVTMTGTSSIMIAASPTLAAGNLRELIALAKKNPGKLTYASPGSGSSMHLAGELLKQEAGIDMLHVPFKGGAQAYPELMSGRIDLQLDPTFSIHRFVQQGKMKAIAVTSAKRDPAAPDVPTLAETVPGFEVLSINGIVVAGKTPRELINRLNADFRKLLAEPEVKKRMEEFGIQIVGNSPEEFAAFIRAEIAKWTKVAMTANVKLD